VSECSDRARHDYGGAFTLSVIESELSTDTDVLAGGREGAAISEKREGIR